MRKDYNRNAAWPARAENPTPEAPEGPPLRLSDRRSAECALRRWLEESSLSRRTSERVLRCAIERVKGLRFLRVGCTWKGQPYAVGGANESVKGYGGNRDGGGGWDGPVHALALPNNGTIARQMGTEWCGIDKK
jgi:hypothetical protein